MKDNIRLKLDDCTKQVDDILLGYGDEITMLKRSIRGVLELIALVAENIEDDEYETKN